MLRPDPKKTQTNPTVDVLGPDKGFCQAQLQEVILHFEG